MLFIPGSVLVGVHVCLPVCVHVCLHCGSAGEGQCIQYVYMRTPGAHTVHMCTCTMRSNTRAHCAGDSCRFYSFSSLFGLRTPPPPHPGSEKVTEPRWRCTEAAPDLTEAATQLNFHGDAFEKCCYGLIDHENHWIQQSR